MTRNIYGDVTDDQGRPSDPGDSAVRNLAVMALMYLESGECPPEDVAAMEAIVAAHDKETECD